MNHQPDHPGAYTGLSIHSLGSVSEFSDRLNEIKERGIRATLSHPVFACSNTVWVKLASQSVLKREWTDEMIMAHFSI